MPDSSVQNLIDCEYHVSFHVDCTPGHDHSRIVSPFSVIDAPLYFSLTKIMGDSSTQVDPEGRGTEAPPAARCKRLLRRRTFDGIIPIALAKQSPRFINSQPYISNRRVYRDAGRRLRASRRLRFHGHLFSRFYKRTTCCQGTIMRGQFIYSDRVRTLAWFFLGSESRLSLAIPRILALSRACLSSMSRINVIDTEERGQATLALA